jgi:hypothetical protein
MDSNEPTTREDLDEAMRALLRQAHDNGVDVKGGWECRNGDEYPDWDVVITEVQKPEVSD